MILYDLTNGNEQHPAYQNLAISNGIRQFSFLQSVVQASLEIDRPFLSSRIIKALNFQAIACLHVSAGEYRPCEVTVGSHVPPPHYMVHGLMDDLVNQVNRRWSEGDPIKLATWVLWRLNWIHPFINGNGRTARTICYFVLCVRAGAWLPGTPTLPELLAASRDRYVVALQQADNGDLKPLYDLLASLLNEQLSNAVRGAQAQANAAPAEAPPALPLLPPP